DRIGLLALGALRPPGHRHRAAGRRRQRQGAAGRGDPGPQRLRHQRLRRRRSPTRRRAASIRVHRLRGRHRLARPGQQRQPRLRRLQHALPRAGAGQPHRRVRKPAAVKYMLLIYQNPTTFQALSDEERTSLMNEAGALWKELTDSGEWVGGEGLVSPAQTKAVRLRDGLPVVTDGPYLEAKEQLAGYL